jgi:hypothetical protein
MSSQLPTAYSLLPTFQRKFWILVCLRYRLIWAQARTSNGRMAILFTLYAFGGFSILFFSLGGLGIAQGAFVLGEGEAIARWALATLFGNGIGLSFLFGLGTRGAFSDQSLRHYPMSARERFIVRHVIGLLDPIWLIVVAGSFGLAIGMAWTGMGSILMGLPAVFLFVLASYLATAVLLSIADIVVATRTGTALFSALVILLVSFGPLAIASLVATHRFDVWLKLDIILQFTPPGTAAGMMAGDGPIMVLAGAGLSFFWCGMLGYLLLKLERRPRVVNSVTSESITPSDFYDQIAKTFGAGYGPLVSKSLRYHLRSNLIRFSLITSPIIVLMGKFLVPGRQQEKFFLLSLAIFFVMSSAAGATLMLNLFGFDESGIRRYAILPISFAAALRAGSFASVLVRAVTVFVAIALWLVFYAANSLSWQMFVMILNTALGSLFLFNALGLWTSVYSPKRLNFDAMWNSRLSFGANLVVFVGIIIPIWGAIFFSDRIDQALLTDYWWISCLILIFCLSLYILSLVVMDGLVKRRRERLINLIAGASDR